jgi:hypothetical protein
VNVSAYPTTRRAAMTPSELVTLWSFRGRCDPSRTDLAELARLASSVWDVLDDDEHVAVYVDASEIAGSLAQPLRVRRLAAAVARCAEAAAERGMCDFDTALDWVEASEWFHIEAARAAKGAHR